MSKNIIYNSRESLDKNFGVIGANLNEIFDERVEKGEDITIIELITKFKMDLKNLGNNDYEKEIPEINIKEISEHIKEQLIKYLDLLIERNEEKEKIALQKKAKQDKRKAKQDNFNQKMNQIQELIEKIVIQEGVSKSEAIKIVIENLQNDMLGIEFTKKERILIIKKLNEIRQKEIESEDKANKESIRRENKVNNIWNQICEIVKKESETGNKTEPEYWIAVRDKFFGESQINMGKAVEKRVRTLLEDEIYYQEVKYYTYDFAFLRDFPEVELGHTPRRGFYDIKNSLRYDDLRVELQTALNEYRKINRLLSSRTDDATTRILQARKTVIEKQREKRKQEGREI